MLLYGNLIYILRNNNTHFARAHASKSFMLCTVEILPTVGKGGRWELGMKLQPESLNKRNNGGTNMDQKR